MNNLNFGEALKALEAGKLVARQGWNGKGQFVFMRPADSIPVDVVIDVVKSLPDSFKQKIKSAFAHTKNEEKAGLNMVQFSSYFCLWSAQGAVINGWVPSTSDLKARDWEIL